MNKKSKALLAMSVAVFSTVSNLAIAAAADWSPVISSATEETTAGKAAIISVAGLFIVLAIVLGVARMIKRSS